MPECVCACAAPTLSIGPTLLSLASAFSLFLLLSLCCCPRLIPPYASSDCRERRASSVLLLPLLVLVCSETNRRRASCSSLVARLLRSIGGVLRGKPDGGVIGVMDVPPNNDEHDALAPSLILDPDLVGASSSTTTMTATTTDQVTMTGSMDTAAAATTLVGESSPKESSNQSIPPTEGATSQDPQGSSGADGAAPALLEEDGAPSQRPRSPGRLLDTDNSSSDAADLVEGSGRAGDGDPTSSTQPTTAPAPSTAAAAAASSPSVAPKIPSAPSSSLRKPAKDADSSVVPDGGEDDDDISQAAVTYAALAAAAMANHKSPAEAARSARLAAQTLLHDPPTHHSSSEYDGDHHAHPRPLIDLPRAAVLERLRRRDPEAPPTPPAAVLLGRWATDNPGFLAHLFLLEYYTLTDDDDAGFGGGNRNDPARPPPKPTAATRTSPPVATDEQIQQACASVVATLKKLEGAYDGLLALLPHAPHQPSPPTTATMVSPDDSFSDDDNYETPVVVPDLLPPCTSARGDATLAFFRACMGPEQSAASRDPPPTSNTGVSPALQQPATQQPPPPQSQPQQQQPRPAENASSAATADAPPSPARHNSFLGMFKRPGATAAASANVAAPSLTAAGLGSVFRKKSLRSSKADDNTATSSSASFGSSTGGATAWEPSPDDASANFFPPPGCYAVKIEREMLGLTVENVLERTVVRTVLPGGPAKKAGAQVGSLITQVGNTSTRNLTHFETIDELRQSQRPLLLVLKQVGDDSLRMAREEMGRLIRGAGFGLEEDRPMRDLRLDGYSHLIRRRWEQGDKLGEKLVWILTLFALGLQREADRLADDAGHAIEHGEPLNPAASPRRRHSVHSHTSQDYADAAKSVGKILWDYSRKKLVARKPLPPPPPPPLPPPSTRRNVMVHATPGSTSASTTVHDKPLLQIGDVLQRTRTFLADTTSPPAALLRGELISFLCDVLDADTDMELAEDESASASVGSNGAVGGGTGPGAAMINDLGSAGSLLKLIVLNAPIMRSPGCDDATVVDDDELRRRFGPRESFSIDDVHKLHAGNRFLSVVHRLAASRSTSARITACSLGPVLWGHLDFPHQLQLRGVITRALHDVEVMVRKSTATVLHEIAELVFDRRCVPWLVLMCERAMTDPEPQLRSAAMTLTWHLAEHLPNAFLGNASQGSRYLRRLPSRDDPIFADVYLLQCKLLPVATRLAEDRSPSVRLAVAAQCDRLCDALGDHWSSVIIDVLLALLSDSDDRVRCEAVACVPRLAEIVLLSVAPGDTAVSEVSVLEGLMPASIKLQVDSSSSVRIALAAAAGDLLGLLVAMQARVAESLSTDPSKHHVDPEDALKKYKRQVDDRLIPLLQTLLNDKDPEVTSAALRAVTNATRRSVQQPRHRHMSTASEGDDNASLSSFQSHTSDNKNAAPVLTPVLSETQVLRLLPTLSELADSKQWRVRQSAVEIVPALLGCTQKIETRKEISKLCVRLMRDDVDAVRRTSAECLCMGGSSLGSHGEDASAEWIASIVVPTIRTCALDADSRQRLLSLKMVQTVLLNGACPAKWKGDDSERMADTPMRELVSISLSLTTDRIANVRLNVGRSLEPVLQVFDEDDVGFIREVILQQIENERESGAGDRDVLYFAERCLQKAKLLLEDRSVGEEI